MIVEQLNKLRLLRRGRILDIVCDEDGAQTWNSQRLRVEAIQQVVDTLRVRHVGDDRYAGRPASLEKVEGARFLTAVRVDRWICAKNIAKRISLLIAEENLLEFGACTLLGALSDSYGPTGGSWERRCDDAREIKPVSRLGISKSFDIARGRQQLLPLTVRLSREDCRAYRCVEMTKAGLDLVVVGNLKSLRHNATHNVANSTPFPLKPSWLHESNISIQRGSIVYSTSHKQESFTGLDLSDQSRK